MRSSSLFEPYLEVWGETLEHSAKCMWKPFKSIANCFGDLPNSGLFFCGFSIILVPLIIAYFTIFLGVLLAEIIFFAIVGFFIGLCFVLVGIWPSLILTVGITGITIIRMPLNIYYHCLITYRTVMLRRNIKLLSFILLPITHLLIPPVVFILCIFVFIPWFSLLAFAGYPQDPWLKIKKYHGIAWMKFATDVKRISQNYGHQSGIPLNWDGSVYGLPVDPIAVVLSIFLYLISLIPISLGAFITFLVKAIPIFLGTLKEFWKSLNIGKSLSWYRTVLRGTANESSHSGEGSTRTRSGHDAWTSGLKQSAKGIKKSIEQYAKIDICKDYTDIMKGYAKLIRHIHPKKLGKLLKSYTTDLSLSKLLPEKLDWTIICLWIPLLLSTIMWILGLVLVLTIPPTTFILVFLVWLVFWPVVIVLPPILYIAGWIFIIFGLPVLYILLWCLILVLPWVFVAAGSVSGPFLALKVPLIMLTYNYHNPVSMWSNMRRALLKIPKMLKYLDKMTGSLSLGNIRFVKSDEEEEKEERGKEDRKKIDYWSLFIIRCIKESKKIQNLGWISKEDIMGASATSVLAIPGVTIVAVLVDSIKKDRKVKTLIYWDEENKCKDSNRDYKDNVANVFWPQLMKVKEALLSIDKDLDGQVAWICASLCDGEDEKSEELKTALETMSKDTKNHQQCLRIRAMVENIVHSLLRVEAMTSRMNNIFLEVEDEEIAETSKLETRL